jgi:hypothetical protein
MIGKYAVCQLTKPWFSQLANSIFSYHSEPAS